jgi:phosphatidylglycerophosphatase A
MALLVATGFGLGYLPRAPGTAASVLGVTLYGLLQFTWEATALPVAFLVTLAGLIGAALWSIRIALASWTVPDPRPIVADEVVGQFLTFLPLLWVSAAPAPQPAGAAGWKSLLLGFILFRGFDVLKPFPIRRLERVAGAAGVVLDDLAAGAYAGLGLWLLAGTGWLG